MLNLLTVSAPRSGQVRALIRLCLAAVLALGLSAAARAELPKITLSAGIHQIRAEVAANDATRQQGLMYCKGLPPNTGMLFVFQEKEGHCFWMKNTLIPLSIAWLDDDGTIVNIADMKPMDESSHCPKAPVRYALEMPQGWYKQKGIQAGTQLGGLPR
ncbi:MAG: DUF192 domain-containing protein [Candidatus Protistobacter heckmanni]|nr:DUF192 domain-containing protein [Candidatus Protistobacter heckmanni]